MREACEHDVLNVRVVRKGAVRASRGKRRPAVVANIVHVHEDAQSTSATVMVPPARRVALDVCLRRELKGGVTVEARAAAQVAADEARKRLVRQQRLESREPATRGDQLSWVRAKARIRVRARMVMIRDWVAVRAR